MIEHTCCFVGHRSIEDTVALRTKLREIIEKLIVDEQIDTFLFGSKSDFNTLCHTLVTELKQTYPHIRRVYVRAEYPYIDESYRAYLLERYEDTYFPEHMQATGKAAYIRRNRHMIDQSAVCVVYYDPAYAPSRPRNSGTKIAYEYAVKQEKRMIDICKAT